MERGIAGKALHAGRMEVTRSPAVGRVWNVEHRGDGDGQMERKEERQKYVDVDMCYQGSQAL